MDDEATLKIPIYHVVSRALNGDQTAMVLSLLQIIPVFCVIISDIHDAEFALTLGNDLVRSKSPAEAILSAKEINSKTHRCPLIVGEADFLDAYFADGTKVSVAAVA